MTPGTAAHLLFAAESALNGGDLEPLARWAATARAEQRAEAEADARDEWDRQHQTSRYQECPF